jgi:hypothetical protein
MFSAASSSRARLDELRQVCWPSQVSSGRRVGEMGHAHQQLAVLLLESVKTTGGILCEVLARACRRERRVC